MAKRKGENPNLKELTKRVLDESALEVFLWAGGRDDLNDVSFGGSSNYCYVRAVNNVSKNKMSLYETDSMTPWLCDEVRVKSEDNAMLNDVNLVAYGPLRSIERKGLIFKKEIERPVPLSVCVENGDNENAYFMRFVINAHIPDSYRRVGTMPYLTLVTGKELIANILNLLRQDPKQYENIVRAIVPKERFPKVNAGILDKMKVTGRVVFLDTEKVPRDSPESLTEKVKKYGEELGSKR